MRPGHLVWQPEEIDCALTHIDDWAIDQFCAEFDRSRASVRAMLAKLRRGWRPRDDFWWTPEEDAFLAATPHLTVAQAGKHLGRTKSAVANRRAHLREKLGISFGNNQKQPNWIGRRTLVAKSCTKCGVIRPGDLFQRDGAGRPRSNCKLCRKPETRRPWQGRDATEKQRARAFEQRMQELTLPALRARYPWIASDHEVLADPDLSLLEKALKLGRTWKATAVACSRNGYTSRRLNAVGEDGEWHVLREDVAA